VANKDEISQRRQRILETILQSGAITVEQICSEYGVSVATARRDLASLGNKGHLRRTYGGATPAGPLLYEPFRNVSSYREQIEKHADEKNRIALEAAKLISDGDTIALTPGTTTTQLGRNIPLDRSITLVTNVVSIAMELSNRPNINVFVTGGFLHGGWFSLVGPVAAEVVGRMFFDIVFLGVNGVHPEHGAGAYAADEAALNRVMAKHAKKRVIVADHSKIGLVATYLFCPSNEIDLLITDIGATDEAISGFVKKGVEVRRV
jgi:DeoR family transcriptional regulator of aga operon